MIVLLYASIFGISLAGTASWETDESEAIPIDQQLLADSACCCDEDDHDTPTAVVNVTIGAENIDASPLIAEDLKTIVRDPVASREISHAIPAAADRHFAFDAALDVSHDAFVRKPVTSNATDRSTKARSFIELSPPITCLLPKKSIPSQGTFNEDAKTAVDAAKKVRQEVLFTSGSWYKQCQTKTIYEHDRMWNDGEEVTFEKEQRKTIQKQLENSPSHHVLNEAQDTALARSAEDAQVDAQDLARVISETAEEVLPDPTCK